MADRTRVRQPLLELIADYVGQRRDHLSQLARATSEVATMSPSPSVPVEILIDGVEYSVLPPAKARIDPSRWSVRAVATGQTMVPARAAERAFWVWAVVEILRLTPIRQEELLELSQTSIRRYQRPTARPSRCW